MGICASLDVHELQVSEFYSELEWIELKWGFISLLLFSLEMQKRMILYLNSVATEGNLNHTYFIHAWLLSVQLFTHEVLLQEKTGIPWTSGMFESNWKDSFYLRLRCKNLIRQP